MRSAAKPLLYVFSLLVLLLISYAQLLLFMYVLRSEGPHLIFLLWFLLASVLTFIFYSLPKKPALLKVGTGIVTGLIAAAGIITVLVQVQVTKRSYAEAWLENAVSGGAFGFFSFFASEIYALFIFVQVFFFAKRAFVSYFFSILTICCLCYGMVFNLTVLLVFVVPFALCIYIFYAQSSSLPLRKRLLRILFPLGTTLVLSGGIASFVWNRADSSLISFPFDIDPLVQRIAPQFPLLTNIPGYGFTPDTQNMPRSTFFTTRSLFEVRGKPNSLHYFLTGRFQDWDGSSWSRDINDVKLTIPVSYLGESQTVLSYNVSETVVLTLLEDFYTVFPIKSDTIEIRMPKMVKSTYTANESDALKFDQSVKRGLQVMLLQSNEKYTLSDEEAEQNLSKEQDLYTTTYTGTAAWKNLTETLLKKAKMRLAEHKIQGTREASLEQRIYLEILLDYFSKDFIYSLSTDAPTSHQNPIEYFLFESKKGFCIYYASAFVLLARSAGIPARLVEGFRIQLDETGRGTITGSSSHTWAEVWVDGRWRIFEPTPPFMSNDPFSYVNERDRTTRLQLEQVFNVEYTKPPKEALVKQSLHGKITDYFTTILIIILIVFFFTLMLIYFLPFIRSPSQNAIKKAKRLVKKYVKKGVLPPQKTGWLLWKKEVEILHKEDAQIADEIIQIIYNSD